MLEIGRTKMKLIYNLLKTFAMIKSFKDLEVPKLSYELVMEIFHRTRNFPKEEIYSLTSQIVRSSRSISANIAEGWAKRKYENLFKVHLVTSIGSCAETENWLSFCKDCKYISSNEFDTLFEKANYTGKMLTNLHKNWKTL
jgi:four helix bundle protein